MTDINRIILDFNKKIEPDEVETVSTSSRTIWGKRILIAKLIPVVVLSDTI